MRILAIRGQNLASLADPFEIDFTQGPLAGAGLFVITGETGAGTSTILDALCLALYGTFPRILTAGGERVPDASDEALAAYDPRQILRKGAGQGFAEVDFEDAQGERCRARWQVARARGRATGRLQNAQRLLTRLEDGAAIAEGIKAVDKAVEARTGLSLDQFRRTALLAQGEFDTFLRADEKDRAALLERITGTAHYSEISKRAHARAAEGEAGVRVLRAKRQMIETRSPDEIAQLGVERDGLMAAVAAAKSRLDQIGVLIGLEARHGLAKRAVDDARERQREAAQAISDAAADQMRLDRLALADRLRGTFEAARHAHAATAAAALAHSEAEGLRAATADAHSLAEATETRARAATAALDEERQRLTEVWALAATLDGRLADAQREADEASSRAAVLRRQLEDAAAAQERAEAQHTTSKASLATLETQVREHASHALLSVERSSIEHLIGQAIRLTEQGRDLAKSLTAAETDDRALAAGLDQIKRAGERERLELAELERELKGREDRLAARDEPALHLRQQAVSRYRDALNTALVPAGKRADASAAAATARAQSAEFLAALAQAEGKREAASAQTARLTAQLHEARSIADLADATLTEAAGTLRRALIEGEPCPVCGSAEHPYAAAGGPDHALLQALRKRRAGLEAELHSATGLQRRADEECASLASRQRAAEETAQQQGAAVAAADRALHPLLAAVLTAASAAADDARWTGQTVASLTSGSTADTLFPLLTEATRFAQSASSDIADRLEEARREREAVTARRRRHAALGDAEAQRNRQWLDISTRAANAAASLTMIRAQIAESQQARKDLVAALAPYLTAAALDEQALEQGPASVGESLAALARAHDTRMAKQQALRSRCDGLEREAMTAKLAAQQATDAVDAAVSAEAIRRAARDDLQAERAKLLGGQPTAEHRRAFEARLAASQKASVDAAEKAQAARSAADRATEAAEQASRGAARAVDIASSADAQLASVTAAAGLTPEDLSALLAVPRPDVVALAEKLAALARTRDQATSILDARLADLSASETALHVARADFHVSHALTSPSVDQAPSIADEPLAVQQALLKDAQEVRAGRLAVIEEWLAADARRIEDARVLDGEIAAAEATHRVWQEIDTAIGSHDGAKFRRFAQALTLDHIAALASAQLAGLKPRYRLTRQGAKDLAVFVLDRDMGEEVRALSSLSGGERFLVALALALALSRLEGRRSLIDTLFIDEGFGALDPETLDVAIEALETLQSQGRRVGVVTHVPSMIERIGVRVRVASHGRGRSVVETVIAS